MHQTQKTASQLLSQFSRSGHSPPARAAARALLLSEETYATVLLLLAIDTYDAELLGRRSDDPLEPWDEPWSAETLRRELERDFSLKLPKVNLDKLMAAISLVTSNIFYKDVNGFIQFCNILSGDDFQPDEFDPADSAEILWGITEASLIWPPGDDNDDTEFSQEIREYIGQVLKLEGVAKPFDVLRLGLNSDSTDHIRYNFSDDPELFQAIWEVQQGKQDDLRQTLLDNLEELRLQLQILPLVNGDKASLVQRLDSITQQMG